MTDGIELSGANPIDEFSVLYMEREGLEARLSTNSEFVRDLLEQGLAAADARLSELAQDPTVREYYVDLGGAVVRATRDLEEISPTLTALGLESQVAAKRAEIDTMASDPKMRAARHLILLTGVRSYVCTRTSRPGTSCANTRAG